MKTISKIASPCTSNRYVASLATLARNGVNLLPIILAIVLYILILFVRYQQGGWEMKLDIFLNLRQSLDQKIESLLPSPQAELLSGILLGQNKSLPSELKLSLRDTSTLHMVVASGQNLSMVAGFFLTLSGLIKRRNALILGLIVALVYSALSGMQIPILRAFVMFGLSSLAQIYGRKNDGVWTLVITAGLMLWVNPAWALSLSFQLSFLATFGVIVIAPILLKSFKHLPLLGQDLAVTLGAQLMVAPVIIQNFHQFSLVSVFANLLVGWTIPFVMVSGTVMLFFSLFITPLAQVTALIASILLTYFIYIVKFFANLSFAWEYVGEQWWIVWVGYYMVVAAVLTAINKGLDVRG